MLFIVSTLLWAPTSLTTTSDVKISPMKVSLCRTICDSLFIALVHVRELIIVLFLILKQNGYIIVTVKCEKIRRITGKLRNQNEYG